MQDIYAFDVGDFGKIGLLRHLSDSTRLRLGVLWWKTLAGSVGGDGKHVNYLKNERFRQADPDLWDAMAQRFDPTGRQIAALHPLFPVGTLFHAVPVPANGDRQRWLRDAREAVSEADIVFCDPDNGVMLTDRCRSVRHIGCAEIRFLWKAGQSLVLYHHFNRSDAHGVQLVKLLTRLHHELSRVGASFGAWFRRGSGRAFLVLAQEQHATGIREAMKEFNSSAWTRDGHFRIIPGAADADVGSAGAADPVQLHRTGTGVAEPPPDTLTAADSELPTGRAVSVVLNDNGGLNAAANPWLAVVSPPCEVRCGDAVSFTVVGRFAGRADMFRVSPSALAIARSFGFTGGHLSKRESLTLTGILTH